MVGVSAVAMVVGTPATPALREMMDAPAGAFCGTMTQGLLLRSGRIEPAAYVAEGGLTCRDFGLDEKNFRSPAYLRAFMRNGKCFVKGHDGGRESMLSSTRSCNLQQ